MLVQLMLTDGLCAPATGAITATVSARTATLIKAKYRIPNPQSVDTGAEKPHPPRLSIGRTEIECNAGPTISRLDFWTVAIRSGLSQCGD